MPSPLLLGQLRRRRLLLRWGNGPPGGRRTPTASRWPVLTPWQGSGLAPREALPRRCVSLPRRSGRPLGVGFCAVPPMAALASPSRRQLQASALQAASLAARDALMLQHLPLANAIASVMARRLFPLVERDDLIQVAREALLRSVPRCKSGEPAEPNLRRCITGALQHHLRDRVRLVRISRRQHEKGTCPLGHVSLDVQVEGEHSLLDQLEAPAAELASGHRVAAHPAGGPLTTGRWAQAGYQRHGCATRPEEGHCRSALAAVGRGLRALMHRHVPSAHVPWLAVDRPQHRPQRRRDLQLLFGPVGQGCQKAASVAVNAEHGVS